MAGNAAGLGFLVVAWLAASHEALVDDQIVWANLAVVGLLTAGAANGLFLRRARILIRRRAGRVAADLGATPGPAR